jgi:hypothetical protein
MVPAQQLAGLLPLLGLLAPLELLLLLLLLPLPPEMPLLVLLALLPLRLLPAAAGLLPPGTTTWLLPPLACCPQPSAA